MLTVTKTGYEDPYALVFVKLISKKHSCCARPTYKIYRCDACI